MTPINTRSAPYPGHKLNERDLRRALTEWPEERRTAHDLSQRYRRSFEEVWSALQAAKRAGKVAWVAESRTWAWVQS